MYNLFEKKEDKYVVIIEPGGIGDYVFCRPFFKYFKESPIYKKYKFIYIVKEGFLDFVNSWDKQYFDIILPYNEKALENNRHYRKYFYSEINKYNIDSVINLRTNVIDLIPDVSFRRKLIKKIKAKYKIADILNFNANKKQTSKLNFYTDIFKDATYKDFEIERRRIFFSQLLGLEIPEVELNNSYKEEIIPDNFIILSIVSMSESRMLPLDFWQKIIKTLNEKYPDSYLLFVGANKDFDYIESFINKICQNTNCINFAGKSNATILTNLMKKAKLMIAVETGTVHIANLVNCPTICFSNGLYYGRYHPYKEGCVHYIYPTKFLEYIESKEFDKERTYLGYVSYPFDSKDVQILKNLKKYLNNCGDGIYEQNKNNL